jgi:hypothetical protein
MALPSNIHDRRYYSYVTAGGVQTAKRTIDLLHQKTHEGDLYNVSWFQTIIDANTLDILMRTSSTSVPHVGFSIESEGNLEIQIYEAASITTPGTALPIFNINRTSTNTATSLFYRDPTVAGVGSSNIYSSYIIGGEKQKVFGGGNGSLARGAPEWNFISNTDYLIRMINQAAVDIIINFNATFYEAGG